MKILFKIAPFIILFALFSCKHVPEKDEFVCVYGQKFYLEGETFFPYMLNYGTLLREVEGEIMFAPTREYDDYHTFDSKTPDGVRSRLNAHFKLISEMGFNSIRIVGTTSLEYDSLYPDAGYPVYHNEDSIGMFNVTKHPKKMVEAIDGLVEAAKKNNLKLMILLPIPKKQSHNNHHRLTYIKSILKRFSSEPTIFAYDFFNEPLYFDNDEYSSFVEVHTRKEDASRKVDLWKALMDKYAPNQLVTIGTSEPIEAFEWDPSVLDVDFVAFHTYNPLRVKNEIYWYAKNVNKPWMIGETGLPADNDSMSYTVQKTFMNEALEQVLNCSGAGFGWWQFQDVEWGNFSHQYLGLLNHDGITITEDGDTILGSLKNKDIPYFTGVKKTGDCECGVNYYNMIGYENYLIEGKIVDENNWPIEGAVIRGWSKEWIGLNTFSASNGKFKLYSNTPLMHFQISAAGKSLSIIHKTLQYQAKSNLKDSTIQNEFLEYQEIIYRHFLKEPTNENASQFDFDEKYFNRYKFHADFGTVRLAKTELYP